MTNQSDVWYACYGSNLSRKRFLCYISACRDKAHPKDDKLIDIPFSLYFAKESKKWDNRGIAFIGLKKEASNITHGRMYLITSDQFIDIVKQENNIKIDSDICIDFDLIKVSRSALIAQRGWYSNVVYLDELNNYPVFTFTAPWDIGDEKFFPPSKKYLLTMILGLKESYGYSDEVIANYLTNKPGIEGKIHKNELINLSRSIYL